MTNAELAIMSLVVEAPRYGYEIEQVIETRGMREWTEVGFSSIYYLLKKLESKGWVEAELTQAERGQPRKVYRATGSGRAAHRAALLQTLSEPARCYPPLQLGLAGLPEFPPHEAAAALRQYRDELDARLAHTITRRDAQRPLSDHIEAMFSFSQAMAEAERDWIDGFICQLESMEEKS
ncbi:MAG: helix-turn-helix transcriptional regulator [Anaerolineae bacterium]|nr:helix-turn-helix transcriptional regulator [Anaerolineae bacterium]